MASGWQGSTKQPPAAAHGLAGSLKSAVSKRNSEAESGSGAWGQDSGVSSWPDSPGAKMSL